MFNQTQYQRRHRRKYRERYREYSRKQYYKYKNNPNATFNWTEWLRQQRRKYPERYRQYRRDYYKRHKDDPKWRKTRAASQKRFYRLHPHYNRTYAREWHQKLKATVIEHYGKACACCGESTYEFLCIDHINGGGNNHREQLGCSRNVYSWLKKNNYPEGFRTLCHNCNQSLGYNGYCPHQQENKEKRGRIQTLPLSFLPEMYSQPLVTAMR